ncbi:hypothetical protein PTTG_12083 [Puccinia triticina 1-1 BBBD Race 1]|uniref:Uncharacterized protein n=1 Tax=Puccinia triticina (isolate 1-1 / race 1 (BBBD)) TaxID=630390 RepID=A0A180GRD7_PUCT1|nr:hypothetical protein PTTG_12083 [Puccinia triticina 1-1 BBBD Race 1]
MRTTPSDSINPGNDHSDVFKNLDSAFEALSRFEGVFDWPYDPHSDGSDHFMPMEFRPSEEKDGNRANNDPGAYYRKAVQSESGLIQPPEKTVAHPKSSKDARESEPSGRNQLSGSKRAAEEIQPLTHLQALRAPFLSTETLWPHDGQPVGSSETLQVSQPHQPLTHQTNTPMQIEAPFETSQTEAEPYVGKPVVPTKRLRADQQFKTPFAQVTQTPAISGTHSKGSISQSDPTNQQDITYGGNEIPKRVTKACNARYFGRNGPTMLDLERRMNKALKHQSPSAKEEFKLLTKKIDEKHRQLNDLYRNSRKKSTVTRIQGGSPMCVRKLGIPENHGERSLVNIDIRIPLQSKSRFHNYDSVFIRVNSVLKALNSYHNLVFLNGMDINILRREVSNHARLLQWFYEQLFTNTADHPPLIATAKVVLEENSAQRTFSKAHNTVYHPLHPEPQEISGEKIFNEAQKRLYNFLIDPERVTLQEKL